MAPANFGIAFAVWAAVVGLVGAAIVYELVRMRSELSSMVRELNRYIVDMERRVTAIEAHIRFFHPGTRDPLPRSPTSQKQPLEGL